MDPSLVPAGALVTVTACIGGACQTQNYTDAAASHVFAISVWSGQVPVSVSVAMGNHQVFTGNTTVETIKSQPNGPGCAPTVWYANVTAHADGQLTG